MLSVCASAGTQDEQHTQGNEQRCSSSEVVDELGPLMFTALGCKKSALQHLSRRQQARVHPVSLVT